MQRHTINFISNLTNLLCEIYFNRWHNIITRWPCVWLCMGTAIHWFWCKPVPGSRTWKIGRAKSGSFHCQTWKGVQYSHLFIEPGNERGFSLLNRGRDCCWFSQCGLIIQNNRRKIVALSRGVWAMVAGEMQNAVYKTCFELFWICLPKVNIAFVAIDPPLTYHPSTSRRK